MTNQLLSVTGVRLDDLYGHILQQLDATPIDHLAIRNDILSHPASQQRLQTASRVVMKRWAVHRDWQADLMQEASVAAALQLTERCPTFEPQGAERFGGWLFRMWYSVCRDVWRKLYVEAARRPLLAGLMYDAIEPPVEVDRPELSWNDVVQAIGELEERQLRDVMSDWANGCSGQTSAALRGVAASTVSRKRRYGMRILRLKLQLLHDAQ